MEVNTFVSEDALQRALLHIAALRTKSEAEGILALEYGICVTSQVAPDQLCKGTVIGSGSIRAARWQKGTSEGVLPAPKGGLQA